MSNLEKKKNFILKSKKIAKHSLLLSLSVFVLSLLTGALVTYGPIASLLGDISVFGALFFMLSSVCLFLLQIEISEKDWA